MERAINWDAHTLMNVTCICGRRYQSKCAYIIDDLALDIVTMTPCPSCKSDEGHVERVTLIRFAEPTDTTSTPTKELQS